jgi:disulfide bond formation protein DsbB
MSGPAPANVALLLGTGALFLILGALGFQYLDRLPPCEICMWQRYPHIAAAAAGIGGYLLMRGGIVPSAWGSAFAVLALCLIVSSGAIGIYQAGIEWQWWPGPTACTGAAFQTTGPLDLTAPVVRCDRAAWRLFGISLAGYNVLFSFAFAAIGLFLLRKRPA